MASSARRLASSTPLGRNVGLTPSHRAPSGRPANEAAAPRNGITLPAFQRFQMIPYGGSVMTGLFGIALSPAGGGAVDGSQMLRGHEHSRAGAVLTNSAR